ncbi:rod shape-determining protein RodA [Hippea alviniae]|uniref:rod shape-determining protein RodA n=1 Tax=Hippea alviniae TaxID=1279027 RepID=UPI0003B5A1F7|nr:rod shape-determining protein RodA [Hippea alviniae]
MIFQINPKRFKYFDYPLFLSVVFISLVGILTISTTTKGDAFAIKQSIWVLSGIIVSLVVSHIDTRYVKRSATIIYLFSLFLLVLVFVNGVLSHGARRWIAIGWVHLQPSEFIKIAVVLMLASYFDENPKPGRYEFKDLIYPALIVALPAIFILKQPDLGTSVIVAVIAVVIFLSVGLRKSLIVKGFALALILIPFAWSNLKPYQKDRIMGFLDPYSAPTTYGYNTIQSEIAIGSGKLIGLGVENVGKSQLSFIPESHTDFIFSVFSEQWGFVGDIVLLFLYAVVFFRAIAIVKHSTNDFDRIAALGIITYLWISVVFNIGMTVGLLPVVGVPLVFFSYGGSSMITAYFAIGILLAIRYKNKL